MQNAANFNWNDVYAKRATNERIKVKQKKERVRYRGMPVKIFFFFQINQFIGNLFPVARESNRDRTDRA